MGRSCAWRNSRANAKTRPTTPTRASAASRTPRTASIVGSATLRTLSSITTCARTPTSWLTKPTARLQPITSSTAVYWADTRRAPATAAASILPPRRSNCRGVGVGGMGDCSAIRTNNNWNDVLELHHLSLLLCSFSFHWVSLRPSSLLDGRNGSQQICIFKLALFPLSHRLEMETGGAKLGIETKIR